MRVILAADIHAHSWTTFSAPVEYRGQQLNSRLVDCARVFDHLKEVAEKKRAEMVVLAGDIFHRRRLLDIPVFNVIAARIKELAASVDHVVLLVGNHDLVKRDWQGDHALGSLGGDKVLVVDRPMVLLDGQLGLIPYTEDPAVFMQSLEDVSTAQCLVVHAGVLGARVGALEYVPREPLALSSMPDVPIYSGHYHYPHKLRVQGRAQPWVYIGSPLEHLPGDGNTDKRGFISLDLAYPSRFTRIRHIGPRFVTLSDMEDADEVAGNFVEYVLPVSESGSAAVLTEGLLERGARGVTIRYLAAPKEVIQARICLDMAGGIIPSVDAMCKAYARKYRGELRTKRLVSCAREALAEAETRD